MLRRLYRSGNRIPIETAAEIDAKIDQPAPPLLGMTTSIEQTYFEEYTKAIYTGAGEIVDLGCWLGSTTIPLARGLVANPRAGRHTIHSYDQFVWDTWMDDCVRGTDIEGKFKAGDSFLDEFRKRTAPWTDRVRVHAGDLCEIGWNNDAIEFLLVDAMKSWPLAAATVRSFFSSLMPGISLVLQQDFAHPYTSWIHLIHYRLRDYFELVHIVPYSQSFVFKYIKPFPRELLDACYSASMFSSEEVDRAFEYSGRLASDAQTRATISASKVMHYVHAGQLAKARAEFARIGLSEWLTIADIKAVATRLEEGEAP